MKLSSKTIIVLLIFILLLGTGLRLYRLGTQDLWHDEVCTVKFATTPWSDLKLEPLDFSHFLFNNFIMHLWLKLGTTAITIRLFSALVGIASIAIMFLIGHHLFDTKVGLLSALFLALSSYHIYYSQEARAYALQIFLILWMVYFFNRAVKENRLRFWLLGSVLSIFTIYLQAFTIFSWIALNIYAIWRLTLSKEKLRIIPWLISQLIVLIVCIPYFVYLTRPEVRIYADWIPQPTVLDIDNTFELYSVGWLYWMVPDVFRRFIVPLFLFLLLLSGLTFKPSVQKTPGQLERYQGVILTWCLFIIPFMLFYVISFKKPIFLSYRYLVITLPFFYLLVSYGITNLGYRTLKSITVILLLFGMAVGLHTYYREVKKIRWSQVAQYLDQNIQENEQILIYQDYWERPLTYYLKSAIPIKPIYLGDKLNIQIRTGVVSYPRTWLVTVTFEGKTPPNEISTTLETAYKQHQIMLTTLSNQPGQAQVNVTLYSNPAK